MTYKTEQHQLTQQLSDLKIRLEKINKDLAKSHSQDFAEQVTERENDEVLEEIARETTSSIIRLKAALKRIQLGTYGLCEDCGQTISNARLQAMPESTKCVTCAA